MRLSPLHPGEFVCPVYFATGTSFTMMSVHRQRQVKAGKCVRLLFFGHTWSGSRSPSRCRGGGRWYCMLLKFLLKKTTQEYDPASHNTENAAQIVVEQNE